MCAAPFHLSAATNRGGRVLDPEGRELHGTYACGWLMRGPTGIIGRRRPVHAALEALVACRLSDTDMSAGAPPEL